MLAFQEELPDFSRYDVICLGTPVWWYGAPQSILTVLQHRGEKALEARR